MKKIVGIKFINLIVILCLFLLFGLVFYYMRYVNISNTLKISSNNSCSIENKVPISDELGISVNIDELDKGIIGEVQFDIHANSNGENTFNYELFLIEENNDMRINANYIKVCLFDENGNVINSINENEVPTFSKLQVSSSYAYARRIYFGKIKGGQKRAFKLRIWLADNYFVGSEFRKFQVKVGANVVE